MVNSGERGVVTRWGKVTNQQLGEGLHIVMPIAEEIHIIGVRTGKDKLKNIAAASADIQNVGITLELNWSPDPTTVDKLYQQFGDKETLYKKVILPATREVVKQNTAKYQAAELIAKREELKQAIIKDLKPRLKKARVIVYDVSVSNITFSDTFTNAIESKVEQQQIALKEVEIVKQREAQAKQAVATAEGNKQAAILVAQGTAEANRLLNASLTPLIIQNRWIAKWDGIVPVVGGGGTNILQMPLPAKPATP
jgi:regulator of protease activity HflC (stomatin/prohibitin superfamily)